MSTDSTLEARPSKRAKKDSSLCDLLAISEEDPASSFDNVMDVLLNRCVLRIGTERYRFLELEMYCQDRSRHDDPFTHGDPMQERNLVWYFHKTGSGYKGGTYKGIDLALGRPGRAVGVLVRSMAPCDDLSRMVSGSCLCVDRILKLASQPDIASFVRRYGVHVGMGQNEGMWIEPYDGMNRLPVIKTARVGLSMKTKHSISDAVWWGKKYRYTITTSLKKGKNLIVCALIEADKSTLGVSTASAIKKCKQSYLDGKKKDVASFLGRALSATDECELLGALSVLNQ